MDLFNLPGVPSTKETDKLITTKIAKKPKKAVARAGMSLVERISNIKRLVDENLGEYKEKYDCIRDKEQLDNYISLCIERGICAIDTETTG